MRNSVRAPFARSCGSLNAGSARVSRMSRVDEGRYPSAKSSDSRHSLSVTNWRSSRTTLSSSPYAAIPFMRSTTESSIAPPCTSSRRNAGWPRPLRTRSTAVAISRQSRTGSLSPRSSVTQARPLASRRTPRADGGCLPVAGGSGDECQRRPPFVRVERRANAGALDHSGPDPRSEQFGLGKRRVILPPRASGGVGLGLRKVRDRVGWGHVSAYLGAVRVMSSW